MSVLDGINISAATLVYLVVAIRTDTFRQPSAERSLSFVLAMLGTALVIQISWVSDQLGTVLRPVGGEPWLWTCLAVLAAAGARSLVVHTSPRGSIRRRAHIVIASVAVCAVTTAFIAAPTPVPAARDSVLAQRAGFYSGAWQSIAHWAIWLAFLTWALTGISRSTARTAQHAARVRGGWLTPDWLARGLRLGTLGCQIGYAYVALKVVIVSAWASGAGTRTLTLDEIADLTSIASITLIVAGSTYDAVCLRFRAVYAVTKLRGLSTDLRRSVPDAAARYPAVGPKMWLQRRLAGIRDRQLALRPYAAPDAPRRALAAAERAGYRGSAARAVAEAAWLEAARRAKNAGGQPHVTDKPYDPAYEPHGGPFLDDELQAALALALAHRHCPLVHEFAEKELISNRAPGR